ncbi:MAG TPA: hypothetical protein VKT51_11960 [Candidatus Eremiobacteraceae bacterium]|nr:hypothetical protein [Candidatus Eremiobacteraceae bacterium]
MKDDREPADAYDRGELTVARFNDSCRDCSHSRPSGRSFLCEHKQMRVFADATCSSFAPRDPGLPFATLAVRRALYHANLTVEIAIEQHMELQTRVAAANGGRVG